MDKRPSCRKCKFWTGIINKEHGPRCDLGFELDYRLSTAKRCPAYWPTWAGPSEVAEE
jgi:hypothetical protein